MASQQKRLPTRYNHRTTLMEKVLQAQTKSCLTKSRNQDEDPWPNLPECTSRLRCIMIGRHFHANMKVQTAMRKDNNTSKSRAAT